MNQRTAWTVYTVLRLVFFAAPFALLYAIGWAWWLAAVVATLIALSLSVIFLRHPRNVASASVYDWRNRDRTEDDIVEDQAADAVEDVTEQVTDLTTGQPGAHTGESSVSEEAATPTRKAHKSHTEFVEPTE